MIEDLALTQMRTRAAPAVPPGVACDEDLWRELDTNRGNLDALAKALNVEKMQLVEALTASALHRAGTVRPGWLRRHWFDLFAALVILAVLGLSVPVLVRGLPRRSALQVVAVRDLAPYHVIARGDIAVSETPVTADALSDPADVAGRYATRGIAARDVLTRPALSAGRLEPAPAGAAVAVLPVRSVYASEPWTFPSEVTVLLTPRSAAAGQPLRFDARLLGFEGSGADTSAVLAFDASLAAEIARVAGSSDVLLVRLMK